MEREQNLKDLLSKAKGDKIYDVSLYICDDEICCDVKVYKTQEDHDYDENCELVCEIVKNTMDEVEAHTILNEIDQILNICDNQSVEQRLGMGSRYEYKFSQVKSVFYGTIQKYYN